MPRFVVSGAGILVKNRRGYIGRIDMDGRYPGRWTSAEGVCTISPAEMMEIARKCVKVRQQVQSTRNMQKKLFK